MGAEKLVKDELYVYVPNAAVLKIRLSGFSAEDITSDYGFLLRLVDTFTIDNDEYYPICYKVNDAKNFKNLVLYILFYTC